MGQDARCGADLPGGRRCQVRRDRCRWHQTPSTGEPATPAQGPHWPASRPPGRPAPGPPAGLRERDVRALAWGLLDRLLDGPQDARTIATAASLLRLVAGLGPEDPGLDEALAAIELHGRAWHGLPPRDSDGWQRAEALFGPEALAELRRWVAADAGEAG